jgi:hypothetical protein
MGDWVWHNESEREATVISSVRAVAVYSNSHGDVVVRQEGSGYGDDPEDAVVVVPRTGVAALVKALKAEAAKPFAPDEEE